jgi:hypothetical protein
MFEIQLVGLALLGLFFGALGTGNPRASGR